MSKNQKKIEKPEKYNEYHFLVMFGQLHLMQFMKHLVFILSIGMMLVACKKKTETTKPEVADITESVYASGVIKSLHQYDVYPKVSGRVEEVLASEGDTVYPGKVILKLSGQSQAVMLENSALAAEYASLSNQKGKLNEAMQAMQLAKNKLDIDSLNFERQSNLWAKSIGSKSEWEARKLQFEASRNAYLSANARYIDLKKQLELNARQSNNNQTLSKLQLNDFDISSDTKGKIYFIDVAKGDLVNPQRRIAVVGSADIFILEMQVDEFDITQVKEGQKVFVSMDSYKNQVFEAEVSKIYPLMNERTKTFKVDARFIKKPEKLYPNVTFEANILLQSKKQVLLIPRRFMKNDSTVVDSDGNDVKVSTGLKDYDKIEILSGLTSESELQLPMP